MLSRSIAPASDHLGVFLPSLSALTDRRIAAKRKEQLSEGHDRALWRGIQSSFKVLINSFYGYLGYGRGYFNDFDAAEAVTVARPTHRDDDRRCTRTPRSVYNRD